MADAGDEGGDPACWAHLFDDHHDDEPEKRPPTHPPEDEDPVAST